MATSPTVLANSSAAAAPALTAPPSRFPLVPLLIAVVAGGVIVGLGVAGAVYYLARAGKLPGHSAAVAKAEPVAPVTTHAIVLEPLLVNLADAGGGSYLRVALTLRVADATEKGAKAKEEKGREDDEAVAAVRDTTLMVLGRQTADSLLSVDGKEELKTDLRAELAKRNRDLKVTDIFFTDFLVQR
jgi:flagellar FliL protein